MCQYRFNFDLSLNLGYRNILARSVTVPKRNLTNTLNSDFHFVGTVTIV